MAGQQRNWAAAISSMFTRFQGNRDGAGSADRGFDNNKTLQWRNAADTANLDAIKINASNVTQFGNANGNLFDGPTTFTSAVTFGAGGAFTDTSTLTAITTAGAGTYTAAAMIGAGEGGNIITRNCNGASRTDTTDTAAAIVAALVGAVVSTSFEFTVKNISSIGQNITVAGGAGVTFPSDTALVIPAGASRTYVGRCTNVGAGTEAVTIYKKVSDGTAIMDTAGLQIVGLTPTASAVNSVNVTNQSTGVNASIAAAGETNTGLDLSSKGTGAVNVFTGNVARKQFAVIDTAGTIINNLTVTGAATTAPPLLGIGSTTDANVGITAAPKGTGAFNVTQSTNTGPGLSVVGVASAVNGLLVTPAATGSPTVLSSAVSGADANAGLTATSNGTGAITFATGNGARSQMKVIDTGGTIINRLTVTGNATNNPPAVGIDTTTDANVSINIDGKGSGVVSVKGLSYRAQTSVTYATPTYALDTTAGNFVVGTTAAGNVTVNAAVVLQAGTPLTLVMTSDAGGGRVITFGTNFRSTGTLTLTASKTHIIDFMSDGTNWIEHSRSASAIT